MTSINALEIILANSYALYLKTQNYHWNVTGKEFRSLHLLFENQYEELAKSIDEIAERIRTLGQKIPALSSFIKLTTISDAKANLSSIDMLKDLVNDQDILIENLNQSLKIVQKLFDEATADLIVGRIKVHQKNKWMLVSSID